ncbi:MAG TPA: cytochrome c [Terriglobales bacterium]|nr:cytochrome c [Terriglobales bacterium]
MQKLPLATLAIVLGLIPFISTKAQGPSTPSGQPAAPKGNSGEGEQVYGARCSACHQKNGKGISSAFPPLAGHVPEAFAKPEGRDYLLRMALYGVEGPIVVQGEAFDGGMPGWALLDDKQLAAVLNYIFTAWGNDQLLPADFHPVQPSEIAAARAKKMSSSEVFALRKKIMAATPGPHTTDATTVSVHPSFTSEQVERGKEAYATYCADCHGEALNDGEYCPPLTGPFFRLHWENGSVAAFHGKLKATMPVENPGSLSDQQYVDLTAFVLSENGYPTGARELPTDPKQMLKMSLKKDGLGNGVSLQGVR